jgi:hypothetical protein
LLERGSQTPPKSNKSSRGAAAAASVTCENATTVEPASAQTIAMEDAASGVPLPPSRHVPFMGYMDVNGIVHPDTLLNCTSIKNSGSEDDDKKCAAFVNEKKASASSTARMDGAPMSAEEILQASLQFDRSHPDMRYSSSLDHFYSSSTRHLYPSLEDVGIPGALLMRSQSQESSHREDSVRTTCADVIESSFAAAGEAAYYEPIVPEPPGEEEFAVAATAVYKSDDTAEDEEEDDVKIGPTRAEPASPSLAYAFASVDSSVHYTSAEATVLGTSETPEERLLAKLAAEDAELLVLKRSAYAGFDGAAASVLSQSPYPEQHATVVAITEHDVHPSDISTDAVRAELIGEDYNSVATFSTTAAAEAAPAYASSHGSFNNYYGTRVATAAQFGSMGSATDAVMAGEEPLYAVVESKATVIASGEALRDGYPAEANVMNEIEEPTVPMEERKLPAVSTRIFEDERLMRQQRFTDMVARSGSANADAVAQHEGAVAVAEPKHVAAITQNEATFAVAQNEAGVAVTHSDTAVAVSEDQAEVLGMSEFGYYEQDTDVYYSQDTCRNHGGTDVYYSPDTYRNHGGVFFADEEAEVVGITEEYHPSEVSGNEAQAELVALCQSGGVEAMAQPVAASGGIQAATIVGYEDADGIVSPGMSRASSSATPMRDRITQDSARAYSAPSAVGTRINPVGTPHTAAELGTVVEYDWMRTPSFRGDLSEDAVVVMQPPRDGEAETSGAAVASLEAYASVPTPSLDDTDCHGRPASLLPAVAVGSLEAYSSAPAPVFSDTDCRSAAVSMQPDVALASQSAFAESGCLTVDDDTDCRLVTRRPPSISVSETNNEDEPGMPPPRSFNSLGGASDQGSVGSATSMSTGTTTRGGFHKVRGFEWQCTDP